MHSAQYQNLLNTAIEAAIAAGQSILAVYHSDFVVENKVDQSPLTAADKASHEVIVRMLETTQIPVLSEEGKHIPYEVRKNWPELWIVDPLDGTKEFVKRNGEFTVNIALVQQGYPVLGVIYVPVTGELFFAAHTSGAYKATIHDSASWHEVKEQAQKLGARSQPGLCRVVASRSHMSTETEEYVEQKRKKFDSVELVSKGSSLKFCLIAEGLADVYPRYAPTMEWDTAAGQIIVEESGKQLIDYSTGKRMVYNRENLLNNWFLVE